MRKHLKLFCKTVRLMQVPILQRVGLYCFDNNILQQFYFNEGFFVMWSILILFYTGKINQNHMMV